MPLLKKKEKPEPEEKKPEEKKKKPVSVFDELSTISFRISEAMHACTGYNRENRQN